MNVLEVFFGIQFRRERARIVASGLFDPRFYLTENADVARAGGDPLAHYLERGWREGRQPSAEFNGQAYLEANPDVAAAGVNPLLHWIERGKVENRPRMKPATDRWERERLLVVGSGLFDADYYLAGAICLDAGGDPLAHYLEQGWREGRQPSAEFDGQAYLEANPDVAAAGINPLLHWIERGEVENRPRMKPATDRWERERLFIVGSGLFDPDYYLAGAPGLDAGGDPLAHYLERGWREGRQPSAEFDGQAYLEANPDVAAAGVNPLLHWIMSGHREERKLPPCPLPRQYRDAAVQRIRDSGWFDHSLYLKYAPWLTLAGIDPIVHYLLHGYKDFLEPSSHISMRTYLANTPSLRISKRNPLLDFIERGSPDASAASEAYGTWLPTPGKPAVPIDSLRQDMMAAIAFRSTLQWQPHVAIDLYDQRLADLVRCTPAWRNASGPSVAVMLSSSAPADLLLNCLDSIARHATRSLLDVVLVDAAETRGAQDRLLDYSRLPWLTSISDTNNNIGLWIERRKPSVVVQLDGLRRLGHGLIDRIVDSFMLAPHIDAVIPRVLQCSMQSPINEPLAVAEADANAPEACYAVFASVDPNAKNIAVNGGAWSRFNDHSLVQQSKRKSADGAMPPASDVVMTALYQPLAVLLEVEPLFSSSNPAWSPPNGPEHKTGVPPRGRLLVLDALTPTPDNDSGSFITVKMLEAFRQLDFDITFFATHGPVWDGKYAAALQASGVRCLYAPYFTGVEQVVQTYHFDYVLAYRVSVLLPHLDTIRRHAPLARLIFHNVDLHYLRVEREAELKRSMAARVEAARLQTMEMETFASVDCSIVHTPVEKALVTAQAPLRNVIEFPYIAEVRPSAVPYEARRDVMFLGGYAHSPNVDAVQFFNAEIWPRLVERLPADARFLIVGASPPPAIQALASERIVVTGMVEDLQPWFDRSRVFVAPLRYGAGIKGKLIQSLAHGVPSVATSVAAEGMGLDDGRHVFVADEPEAIAAAVLALYADAERWREMQAAGYAFVGEKFSWTHCLDICRAILATADQTWLRREETRRKRRIATILEAEGHQEGDD